MFGRRVARAGQLVSIVAALTAALTAALACRDRERPPDVSATDTSVSSPTAARASEWVRELGPLLVVPSDSQNTGVVLFPADPSTQLFSDARLTLLSAAGDGKRASASLEASDARVCGEAPTIRLDSAASSAWAVGLQMPAAAVLRMDSIEALSPPDSTGFAMDLARLASTLVPADGSRFSGSPFVVLSARRFEAANQRIVVAHLVRRLPQEASPLEEHTFVVAERAVSSGTRPYVVAHHQRSVGTEETVDHYDVLAAVRSGTSVFLVVSAERDSQTVYQILERSKMGWRLRWDRTLAC